MEFLTHNLIWIIPICTLILIAILVFIPKLQVRWSGITDSEKRLTERFTRAIDQLGSMKSDDKPNIEVRLGGIYALEKIAKAEPEDYHWTIMEVLTTYIRENAPFSLNKSELTTEAKLKGELVEPDADIQAILTVIGRRKSKYDKEGQYLDLAETKLYQANLGGANLRGANLVRANLVRANLVRANLVRANLGGAYLRGANLGGANLGGANLVRAYLVEAYLVRANLRGANLGGANLREANLREAYLREANLGGATLVRANLVEATLRGANLGGAKELTIDQLCITKTLYKIKNLDSSLMNQVKERCPELLEEPKPD